MAHICWLLIPVGIVLVPVLQDITSKHPPEDVWHVILAVRLVSIWVVLLVILATS